MPPNEPRSRKGPNVARGNGQAVDDDGEKNEGTVRRNTSSLVSRGTGRPDAAVDDPEAQNQTNAQKALKPSLADRKKRPSVVERGSKQISNDPERLNKTNTSVPVPADGPADGPPLAERSRRVLRPKAEGVPPESSEAEWEAPPGKMSREMSSPEYNTGAEYDAGDLDESNAEYKTGNDYKPLEGEEGDEISIEGKSLEGDGLDALDPDLDVAHSKTRNLPANYDGASDGDDDDDGADDANATNAGNPLKLEIVGGPDTGKKKKFRGVRMVIGRTPGVDLQLTDQSVSRRHVELIAGDGGVMLRDLGSGNGSKVNGEKVTEKVLVHGDEIHIGKTKIRFVDEVGAFKKAREDAEKKQEDEKAAAAAGASADGEPAAEGEEGAEAKAEGEEGAEAKAEGEEGAEAKEGEEGAEAKEGEEGEEKGDGTGLRPAVKTGRNRDKGEGGLAGTLKSMDPKKRAILFGGVGFFIILIIIFAVTRPKAPPPPDPLKTEAAEKMQLARDAVRAERYEDAINLIEQAEKLVPGIDQTKLATQARAELAVVTQLDEVKKLIDESKFEDAKALLAKAPQGAVKTEEAKKKLGDKLAEAEAAYKKQRFSDLIAQGELEAAAQALTELPPELQREMAPVLDEAKVALEKTLKDEQRQAIVGAANAKARSKAQKAEAMTIAYAVVQRKFAGQEWARAAAECDRVTDANPGDDDVRRRSKLLQQLIPNYGRNYEEGMKKFRAGQIASSVRPLRKAWELYQQIDFQTPMGEELKEKLAQAAIFAGKEALLREDLATAAMNFRDAARLDPDEPKAKELLNDVIGRADELYQGAYMIRDRDPQEALKRFKVVVEITPSGSTVHEKAKNQIAAMQP